MSTGNSEVTSELRKLFGNTHTHTYNSTQSFLFTDPVLESESANIVQTGSADQVCVSLILDHYTTPLPNKA